MVINIARVKLGTNEDGSEWYGPAEPPPVGYLSVVITEEFYVYTMPE